MEKGKQEFERKKRSQRGKRHADRNNTSNVHMLRYMKIAGPNKEIDKNTFGRDTVRAAAFQQALHMTQNPWMREEEKQIRSPRSRPWPRPPAAEPSTPIPAFRSVQQMYPGRRVARKLPWALASSGRPNREGARLPGGTHELARPGSPAGSVEMGRAEPCRKRAAASAISGLKAKEGLTTGMAPPVPSVRRLEGRGWRGGAETARAAGTAGSGTAFGDARFPPGD